MLKHAVGLRVPMRVALEPVFIVVDSHGPVLLIIYDMIFRNAEIVMIAHLIY
jgi:hypothetical protein